MPRLLTHRQSGLWSSGLTRQIVRLLGEPGVITANDVLRFTLDGVTTVSGCKVCGTTSPTSRSSTYDFNGSYDTNMTLQSPPCALRHFSTGGPYGELWSSSATCSGGTDYVIFDTIGLAIIFASGTPPSTNIQDGTAHFGIWVQNSTGATRSQWVFHAIINFCDLRADTDIANQITSPADCVPRGLNLNVGMVGAIAYGGNLRIYRVCP